jgi:hypothetical protein
MVDDARRISRRRFIRRAGAATAGVAAAAAVASPAQADPGDPVVLGSASNDAGAAPTTITSSGAGPTLRLRSGFAAYLRTNLVEPAFRGPAEVGRIAAEPSHGDFVVGTNVALSGSPVLAWSRLLTTANASMTVPTTPTRVLDTRTPAGRGLIVGGEENIDGQGRLRGGTAIVLTFDPYLLLGLAVHLNLTVTRTTAAGYLTVWGIGVRPTASALNWWGANQVLSNGAMSLLGTFEMHENVVAIFASTTTAVVADLTGFDVNGPWRVFPVVVPGVTRPAVRKDATDRALALGAARAAGGPRHAAPQTPVVPPSRQPGSRALRPW